MGETVNLITVFSACLLLSYLLHRFFVRRGVPLLLYPALALLGLLLLVVFGQMYEGARTEAVITVYGRLMISFLGQLAGITVNLLFFYLDKKAKRK